MAKVDTDSYVLMPKPTNVAATDDANFAAAIVAAGSTKVIVARAGTYAINNGHVIPDGVDLRGAGGGSTSRAARTSFKCTAPGAYIEFQAGGAKSGGFDVHGNDIATTPFRRTGGLGANGRYFENIIVRHNAAGANDLMWLHYAQNDGWFFCGAEVAAQDMIWFDGGYGGATFYHCHWDQAGRYHHRYDNQLTSTTYPTPTDIHHIGGIFERNSGISIIKILAGGNITFSDMALYSANGCSGPQIDIGPNITGISLHNLWNEGPSGGPPHAGSIGLRVASPAHVTLSGRAIFQNLETAIVVDGVTSFAYMNCSYITYNVTTNFAATGGGNIAQILQLQSYNKITATNSTDFIEIAQPLARDRYLYSRNALGAQSYYPNTAGNFTPDITTGRKAAGLWGVINQQMLGTGGGTTAQRPAGAAALKGALYTNDDTGGLDWVDSAGVWHETVDKPIWIDATGVAGVGTNPHVGSAPLGYCKMNGIVRLRGMVDNVSIGGGTIFTLPVGMRPAFPLVMPIATYNGTSVLAIGAVNISVAGLVSVSSGSGAVVSLDGVSFVAA
jgi:hypothetical protein